MNFLFRSPENMMARHGDKGSWKVNEEELQSRLPKDEATLILSVLQNEEPDMKETPLKLEGLERSLRLGDRVFSLLPERAVLVVADSGKERARLTRELVTGRIAQQEERFNQKHPDARRRIDMLHLDGEEIARLMQDSHDGTWGPYADAIKEGISESEALSMWLQDMNKPNADVPAEQHPKESSERYRQALSMLREKVTSEKVPVVYLGIGHSGSLGQMKYEKLGDVSPEEIPQFCELYILDEDGEYIRSEGVEL